MLNRGLKGGKITENFKNCKLTNSSLYICITIGGWLVQRIPSIAWTNILSRVYQIEDRIMFLF